MPKPIASVLADLPVVQQAVLALVVLVFAAVVKLLLQFLV